MIGIQNLYFLDRETEEELKKKVRKIGNCKVLTGIPREDRTIDILLIGENDMIEKIKGKVKNGTTLGRGIDLPKEDKMKIYDKEYFKIKEKVRISYQNEYENYYAMVQGLKGVFPDIKRVLDVGCGRGTLVRSFNELGIEAHGVDISKKAISEGLRRAPHFERKFHICDVDKEKLPFNDDYFELITMIYSIEHFTSPGECLKEVRRVLKPEGHVLVVTHILGSEDENIDKTHLNVRSRESWMKLFEKYGFGLLEEREFWQKVDQYVNSKPPSTKKGKKLVEAGKHEERRNLIRGMIKGRTVLVAFPLKKDWRDLLKLARGYNR